MAQSHAYLRLRGEYGNSFRQVLETELLPVVSPIPEELDGGEYGKLMVLNIDAARLSAGQQKSLIDWIWKRGDNSDRAAIQSNVLANKASYVFRDSDQSEILFHDPNAWG